MQPTSVVTLHRVLEHRREPAREVRMGTREVRMGTR